MRSLESVKAALLTVTNAVYHYEADHKPDRYIVWAEDGSGTDLSSNNKKQIQVVQGTIHLYTKQEFDPFVEQIQSALTEFGICWTLNSVQYEDEVKFIHYEWVFEVN